MTSSTRAEAERLVLDLDGAALNLPCTIDIFEAFKAKQIDFAEQAITAAEERGRQRGLDEAAHLCESIKGENKNVDIVGYAFASQIRELKQPRTEER